MSPENKKIFVIVVTYKGGRWYDRCFGSLRESEIPLHVIAVDNSPGEEDAEYIRTHFPEVHIIKTNENLGFGKANNLGMRYALDKDCDYVFLLNQDAWIEPNSIRVLVEVHQINPNLALLSPMHVFPGKSHLNILLGDVHHNYELLSDLYFGILKDYYDVRYVNAAAWLIPYETINVIGGFDPLFTHFGEDDDYLNRLCYHRLSIVVVPKVRISHDHSNLINPFSKDNNYRHQQCVLMDLLNLNKSININKECFSMLMKVGKSVLKLNKKIVKIYWSDFLFILRNKKKIEYSRKNNSECKRNWL